MFLALYEAPTTSVPTCKGTFEKRATPPFE